MSIIQIIPYWNSFYHSVWRSLRRQTKIFQIGLVLEHCSKCIQCYGRTDLSTAEEKLISINPSNTRFCKVNSIQAYQVFKAIQPRNRTKRSKQNGPIGTLFTMCGIELSRFPLWLCLTQTYRLSHYDPRKVVQTRARHDHEYHLISTKVCSPQIHRRRNGYRWN